MSYTNSTYHRDHVIAFLKMILVIALGYAIWLMFLNSEAQTKRVVAAKFGDGYSFEFGRFIDIKNSGRCLELTLTKKGRVVEKGIAAGVGREGGDGAFYVHNIYKSYGDCYKATAG